MFKFIAGAALGFVAGAVGLVVAEMASASVLMTNEDVKESVVEGVAAFTKRMAYGKEAYEKTRPMDYSMSVVAQRRADAAN